MSDSNRENDSNTNKPESSTEARPSSVEGEPDSNDRTSLKNISKDNAVLSTIKTNTQAQEIIISSENVNDKDAYHAETDVQIEEITINSENVTGKNTTAAKIDSLTTEVIIHIDNFDVKDIQIVDMQPKKKHAVLEGGTEKVSHANKPYTQGKVAINLEDLVSKDFVAKKECMTYEEYGQQIRPPRTIWVMYEGASGGEPLSYEPSRNGFIRLVFIILLVMLLITAAFVGTVLAVEDLKDIFIHYGVMIALPAMIVMIGISYAIACSPCTRSFPCNIIILVVAVICMSIICAYITSRYKTEIVLLALLATCVVVLICVGLSFSGFDFTSIMLYIILIGAAFGAVSMIAGITMLITGTYMRILHLVILIIGTIIHVFILTMEIQMVLGGGAVELGENEYALAAYLLYSSIVDIFLKLVQITGILDNL